MITGRGPVAVCQGMPPGMDHPAELLGKTVSIDGDEYVVRGTETLGVPWRDKTYNKPYGLLVRKTDDAQGNHHD